MKKMALLLAALLLLSSLAGCGKSSKGEASVESVSMICGLSGVGQVDRFAGVVSAQGETKIAKDENRQVASVAVKTGDEVKKGQTLFTYDQTQAQLDLEKAQLELEQMKSTLSAKQEEKARQEEAARQAALDAAHRTGRQAARQALLDAYDGAMATRQITVYAAPSDSAASLRTLRQGKVARLNDVTEDGSWYQITFSGTTGYVRSDACQAVQYSDYAGTSAVKSAREDLVDYAKSFLGTRYVWGGASPSGFDCSGFTMYVYAHFGYRMSHGASDQLYAFTRVSSAQRLPGDLVFFSYGGGDISHVGIYLGGGAFIHATSNGGVKISYFDGYYSSTYVGAVRILAD